MKNLAHNPEIEINVVDPIRRKGYRFKGQARIVTQNDELAALIGWYRQQGVRSEMMPSRLLCNGVQREDVKLSPDLACGLFCYAPLHNIWYSIRFMFLAVIEFAIRDARALSRRSHLNG